MGWSLTNKLPPLPISWKSLLFQLPLLAPIHIVLGEVISVSDILEVKNMTDPA